MDPNSESKAESRSPRRSIALWELMVLIGGAGLGFALFKFESPGSEIWPFVVATLGGVSLVGVPLLLLEGRNQRPWGPGRFLWFIHGTAAWLLWPPTIYYRLNPSGRVGGSQGGTVCFFYGTPLMAVYVTIGLFAGRRLRCRRRRRPLSWRESFGIWLGAAWACTGFWLLSLIYRDAL